MLGPDFQRSVFHLRHHGEVGEMQEKMGYRDILGVVDGATDPSDGFLLH